MVRPLQPFQCQVLCSFPVGGLNVAHNLSSLYSLILLIGHRVLGNREFTVVYVFISIFSMMHAVLAYIVLMYIFVILVVSAGQVAGVVVTCVVVVLVLIAIVVVVMVVLVFRRRKSGSPQPPEEEVH